MSNTVVLQSSVACPPARPGTPLCGSDAAQQSNARGVSVVIVSWNAKQYVLECLGSLRAHCAAVYDEIIVVDNSSTDGTPEAVALQFPECKLIRNSENLGFAKGNNIGIASSSGEYVCLVNSDVKFTNDCLSPMLSLLSKNQDVGMVGPKMLSANGEVERSTMRFPTVWNQFCRALGLDIVFKNSRFFGGQMMADFDHKTTSPVEVLNGWFVVVRRAAMRRVGIWDPRFFMYGEDIDWCYRFHQAGEKLVFCADAEAVHYGGASSSKAPLRFYLEMTRANWQYWQKHHGRVQQLAFLASCAIYHILRLVPAAVLCLFLRSRRGENYVKLKKNLVGLYWVARPHRDLLQMAMPSTAKPV